ncbi:MAG: RagB/SusD family nutrient uptake outer membrane protein [Bacteroidales bacterium]|nr:RagB/SusD family nutrient uptake outer membrane protein [Bacteroidales bacterium]
MKTYRALIFIMFLIVGFTSCNEFLEEEYLSGLDTETFYSTPEGMESLIAACYATNKIYYAKEEGFDFSVCGTDIYDYGQQHPQQYQYTFTSDFNSTNSRLVVLWIEFYKGVNACNDAIEVLSDPSRTPFNEELTKIRLAEVRFLRAHLNWLIVETWGGVELRKSPVEGVVKTATRSSVEDFYALILEDLDFAVTNLGDNDNVTAADYGRVTKWAAMAFRARMRLTWAGYTNSQTLYTDAAADAAAVIGSGKFTLYDNYADVWNIANNSNNSENIWCINYSLTQYAAIGVPSDEYTPYQRPGDKTWDSREGGHHGHLMFGSQYDVYPGMTRDIENGRPFRRYSPTKYLIDCFKENVDERFHGSFKTTWFVNAVNMPRFLTTKRDLKVNTTDDDTTIIMVRANALSGIQYYLDSAMIITHKNGDPNDTILTPGAPYLEIYNKQVVGKFMFDGAGDTCIHYTKGLIPDEIQLTNIRSNYIWNMEKGYWCLDYNNMFNADGTINDAEVFNRNIYLELSKFLDPTRPAATDAGSQRGQRDAYVMRISEMYLIAAEALFKTGQADNAYSNYLIPLANKRSYDGNGAAMLSEYGINGGSDLTMNYFMDERARELCGEQLRWFDLKRLGTDEMVARIKQYSGNTTARENFDAHFAIRPIPQVQLDAITNKDEFPQNPDYQ